MNVNFRGTLMKKDKFCPNCKANIADQKNFCTKFGHYFRTKKIKKEQPVALYIGLSFIALILLILGSTYTYGKFYYSRERQLRKMALQMTSKNPEDIAEVAVNSKGIPYTPSELKPLTDLYKSSKKEQLVMKEKVENASTNGSVQLIQIGKIFGLYPRYRIVLKPVNLTVKTNLHTPTIFINDYTVVYAGTKSEVTEKRLPGKYTVNCTGLIANDKQKLSKTILLSPIEEDNLVSFNVNAKPKIKLQKRYLFEEDGEEKTRQDL